MCYVGKGYSQIPGVDFGDMFAPVTRITLLCFILALTAAQNLPIIAINIKSVFLNAPLEEDIYVEPPDGFCTPSSV